ncbi:MAG: hypothetical protein Q4A79_00615, partial [Candidatus Saccharibacteria bacterium]|nr:hypothetical protein [Candidatus Saccharibacteria bacterium]
QKGVERRKPMIKMAMAIILIAIAVGSVILSSVAARKNEPKRTAVYAVLATAGLLAAFFVLTS